MLDSFSADHLFVETRCFRTQAKYKIKLKKDNKMNIAVIIIFSGTVIQRKRKFCECYSRFFFCYFIKKIWNVSIRLS